MFSNVEMLMIWRAKKFEKCRLYFTRKYEKVY